MNHAYRRHTLKLLLLTFTGKINAIMWVIAFITPVAYDAIRVQYFNRCTIWEEVATSSSTILFWERDEVVFKIIAVLPLNLQCCYYVIWLNLGLNMCHYPALKICWTQHQTAEIKTPTAHFYCHSISVVSWKQRNKYYLPLFLGFKLHKEISRGVQRNVTATS